jgi:hypothetical protein
MTADIQDGDVSTRDMLEHTWRYFALHAQQRISIFNFFLILSGLVAAGLAACVQRRGTIQLLGAGLGALLCLVSFTFYKLDQRSSFLIKHSENAIAELEQLFPIVGARLVFSERHRTAAAASSRFAATRLWTYGTAFRLVFVVMGSVGIVGAFLCLYLYSCRH